MQLGWVRVILVVDDQPIVLDFATFALARAGYTVLAAKNGKAALKLAETFGEVDLVITDFEMPGMNGVTLAHRFEAVHDHTRVIIMSGRDRDQIPIPGRWKFLAKPFTAGELVRAVADILGPEPGAAVGGVPPTSPLLPAAEVCVENNGAPSAGFDHTAIAAMRIDAEKPMKTEIRTLGEMEQRVAHLEMKTEEQEAMLGLMAHDLRSEVRRIKLFNELISSRGVIDEEFKTCTGEVGLAASRLLLVFEQARKHLISSQDQREGLAADIGIAIEEAILPLRHDLIATRAVVHHVWDGLPRVAANPALLSLAFQNLIANSLKFAKPGSPPEITITAWPTEDGRVEIRVNDRGIGIDPADAERIFERFTRASAIAPGMGLGLHNVHTTISRFGGKIWVVPNPEGAEIHLMLNSVIAENERTAHA